MQDASSLLLRVVASLGCLAVGIALGPRTLVGRDADARFDDAEPEQRRLADAVAAYVLGEEGEGAGVERFHTGSTRFDGEWAFGTLQMAVLGMAQVAHAHPELAPRYRPAATRAADTLVSGETYAFAADAWGEGPFDDLHAGRGHAYLGYVALALGAVRELDPETPHAALHDELVAALARRLEASPQGIVETYPGEAYPCDIASIVGALGQHDRLTGGDHGPLVERMAALYRERWIDPASGYLVQAIDPRTGAARDAPRGSGTALAAYFWSFADPALAHELDRALLARGRRTALGLGAIAEYPDAHEGLGDIDSGPVLLGVSVSATGFSLAAARRRSDRSAFRELYRTASLFGVPVARGERTRFLAGGPLGNAILLAMTTARAS
jgi:hypothetical protein